jgi:hypothetical protein
VKESVTCRGKYILGPGAGMHSDAPAEVLPDDVRELIRENGDEEVVYLLGHIVYTDAFGRHQEIDFRFECRGDDLAISNFTPSPEGNFAKEDNT